MVGWHSVTKELNEKAWGRLDSNVPKTPAPLLGEEIIHGPHAAIICFLHIPPRIPEDAADAQETGNRVMHYNGAKEISSLTFGALAHGY
jgi:hypothetical protein